MITQPDDGGAALGDPGAVERVGGVGPEAGVDGPGLPAGAPLGQAGQGRAQQPLAEHHEARATRRRPAG